MPESRRHLATCLYRAALLVLALWWAWAFAIDLLDLLAALLNISSDSVVYVLQRVLWTHVPRIAALLALFLLERRLIHWVVPLPRTDLCPRCGYSIKNLRTPICPECGTSLKSPAA